MAVQIQFRRGTAALWTSTNPILGEGEVGVELGGSSLLFKMGDGLTHWNSLPYASGPVGPPGTGIEWRGDWVDNISYLLNDAVHAPNGSAYVCNTDTPLAQAFTATSV